MKKKLIILAKSLVRKYGHVYILLFGAVTVGWFLLLEHFGGTPVIWLHTRLDDKIPFVKEYVIPYILWYPYMVVPMIYFGFKSPSEFLRLGRFMFAGLGIACFVYTVLPNGQHLRPTVLGQDVFSRTIANLYANDTPTNSAPSIHVINSVAVHLSLLHSPKAGSLIKSMSLALCVLICLSTVFIKQHSVIDVFTGLIVCLALYLILYRDVLPVLAGKTAKDLA